MSNNGKNPLEYLTTEEAIAEFPYPAKLYEWTTRKLRTIAEMGFIKHKYDNNIKRFVFRRGSIVKSLRYILKNGESNNDDLRNAIE